MDTQLVIIVLVLSLVAALVVIGLLGLVFIFKKPANRYDAYGNEIGPSKMPMQQVEAPC